MRIPMLVIVLMIIIFCGFNISLSQDFNFSASRGKVAGAQETNYDYYFKTENGIISLEPQEKVETIRNFDVFQPRSIKLPFDNNFFKAASVFVFDVNNNSEIYSKNGDQIRQIASITKLMTALVFLEHNPGWEKIKIISNSDRREGGRIYLYKGEKVFIKDLFNLSLIASANTATMALVNSTGLGEKEFVNLMNQKAKELGLKNTHFDDPIGLSINNISTGREIATLAQKAFSRKEIREAVQKKEYSFKTLGGKDKKVYNTNFLIKNSPQKLTIIGGKTGYTEAAGYCLVTEFEEQGRKFISVFLGEPSYYDRFKETRYLIREITNQIN